MKMMMMCVGTFGDHKLVLPRVTGANKGRYHVFPRRLVHGMLNRDAKIDLIMNCLLFYEWLNCSAPAPAWFMARCIGDPPRRKAIEGGMVIMNCESQLTLVIGTLHSSRRFSRRLNRWQKQTDQDPNDCNHDQQFDEGEAASERGSTIFV